MIRRPPRSTRTTPSFPTRRSSDLDRAGRGADREAEVGEALVERLGVVPELLAQARLRLDLAERGQRRGDARGRRGGGEHVRPAGEAQPLEGRVVGHAEAADRAEALAEGADDVRSEEHTSELQSLMR